MTKQNSPLLEEILTQIIAHPETHNQDYWRSKTHCGTTYCVAGWAVQLTSGYMFDQVVDYRVYGPRGGENTPAQIARRLLGLSAKRAKALFYASNPRAIELIKHYLNTPDENSLS